jgi:hypothetical protein
MKKKLKFDDAIYTVTITIDTGSGLVFYWMQLPCPWEALTPAKQRKLMRSFMNTPAEQRHGPFNSEAE